MPLGHGGHRRSKLMPHRDFLEALRAEKADVTLHALCGRLLYERGVKADTSMMSHDEPHLPPDRQRWQLRPCRVVARFRSAESARARLKP